jgi:hypothetical protein
MAYPDKDTAEFWHLVAQGYRQLAEKPPKFMAPGSSIEGFMLKAKEAEAKATKLDSNGHLAMPTEAFEESLQRKEAEMVECGAKLLEPKRSVTEDVWRRVLGLD